MGATEAHELKLYIDNDASLHRQQHVPILKNLASKKFKSQYKHDLAVKAFGHLVESGAKKYAKEFGSPGQAWHKMFDAATRKIAAEDLTRDFEGEFELGNYDHLLPKKHQKELSKPSLVSSRRHAKKIAWRTPEGIRVEWSVPNNTYFALWPTSAPVTRQQVLKVADANEMDAWLRDTYGTAYGRSGSRAHSTITKRHTFAPGAHKGHFCAVCGRDRSDSSGGHYVSAMPNMPKARAAQLDREIADVVPSWRGGR
jgi:hypothetical protein